MTIMQDQVSGGYLTTHECLLLVIAFQTPARILGHVIPNKFTYDLFHKESIPLFWYKMCILMMLA